MVRSDSPFIVDIYLVSIRWLLLLGSLLAMAGESTVWQSATIFVWLAVGWNGVLLSMAGRSQRLTRHREINLAIDLIFSVAFVFSGQIPVLAKFLFLLLPISTAAMYFNLRGALYASLFASIVHLVGTPTPLSTYSTVFSLAYGFVYGYLSQNNYDRIQLNRKWQLEQREKAQKAETNRIRAIYNHSMTITSMLSYNRVLEAALDLSTGALFVDGGISEETNPAPSEEIISAMLLDENGFYKVVSSRNLVGLDENSTFAADDGLLALLKIEKKPIVVRNLKTDPQLSNLANLPDCGSVFALPMVSGYETYGVMLFGHENTDYFSQERCEILGIVGRQAVVAMQNAKLYQEISDEKEKIAEVEEETRKKIARDLHDGPTQSVTAIAMRVNLARRMLNRDLALTSEELVKIEELARQTTREIRHMLFSLRPIILETEGLASAIKAISEKMKEVYGKSVLLDINESVARRVDSNKASILFFIIDEAVTNAQKHANAEHIRVQLGGVRNHPDIVAVEIADDGIGFDLDEVNKSYDKRGSLGLINLRERTEILSGLLSIQSKPSKGTVIRLFFPLTEQALETLRDPGHKPFISNA